MAPFDLMTRRNRVFLLRGLVTPLHRIVRATERRPRGCVAVAASRNAWGLQRIFRSTSSEAVALACLKLCKGRPVPRLLRCAPIPVAVRSDALGAGTAEPWQSNLLRRLEQLAAEYDLPAAHWAESVPDGVMVGPAVARRLDAAVCSGTAIGLRHAIGAIEACVSTDSGRT